MRNAAATVLLPLLLAACGAGDANADGAITVLAAASLTDPFTQLGEDFEAAEDGSVRFSFGPSDGLAQQIDQGSPADVFASASGRWMDFVQDEGPGVSVRADFARNTPVVIVPADNPAGISSLHDLANDGVRLVLAAEGVPIGDYAREILANAGVTDEVLANVVSNEEDVKAVVQKVVLGEADAGIAYATDVTSEVADRIARIDIPEDVNVVAAYPIAVVADAANGDTARAFVAFVLSAAGQSTLQAHGFLPAE